MARRLTRNPRNAVLGGVSSGIADYLDIDTLLVRLGFIILCLFGGVGILLYVICWLVIPRRDEVTGEPAAGPTPADRIVEEVRQQGEKVIEDLRDPSGRGGRGRIIAGGILIGLGLIFLVDRLPWFHRPWWLRFESLWPVILVVIGIVMLVRAGREGHR